MFFTLKPKILYYRGGRYDPNKNNGKGGIKTDREAAIEAEAKKLEELKKRDPKGREKKSLEGRMKAGTTVSGQDNEVYKQANYQGSIEETGPSGSGNYDEEELNAYLQSVNKYRIGNTLDEHAQGIDNIDKKAVIKSLAEFHGIEQSLGAAANRQTGKDRKALDALLMKYATPKDMLGIGGMPPVFLDNTDPNGYKDKSVVGHHYFVNNILYGTFVAFKPGFIRWDITKKQTDEIQGGGASPGFFSRAWAGTLAYNRPYVDGYYRDVSRTMRMVAFMMGLADVAFPFSLSYTQQAKQGVDNTIKNKSNKGWVSAASNFGKSILDRGKQASKNVGNQGGYQQLKGSYLLATAGGNAASVMTGETYRALGQALASIIVNKQATPIGETEVGDAGFVAFRVDGNIEPSESLSNSSAGNPVKELAESVLGDTDDMIGHLIGRMFGDGSQDSLGALAFITGKPMLPNIWRESSFSKSYSINFVFSSAYGNKLSLLLQVMYPTVKLFHLAAPTGIGGFMTSPPICRVFSAGTINTEYGMISSFSIQRDMKTLSDDGIPTSLSVNITVEDLNPFLYKEKPGWFNKSVELSTGLTIFMATLVGQNISTISRTARQKWNETMLNVEANISASDIANRINYGIADFVGGAFTQFYDWSDSVKTKWVKLKGTAAGLGNLATGNNPENPNSRAAQASKNAGIVKTSGNSKNKFKGNK